MDMSSMGSMEGMDMSSDSAFKNTNMHIARVYWYLAVAVIALLTIRRGVERLRNRLTRTTQTQSIHSQPQNLVTQTYDTIIAICREIAYPQLWWCNGSISKYLNPPALGRCLFLCIYWMVILTMLWSNTILSPSSSMYAYKWEIVGFRAAWVSVTQLPLIYLLGGKITVVGILTGISYERINWLHRWIARTLFLTVIVHWSFFFREWWIADFVKFELKMMPMTKYGFGAWAVLGWMILTGLGFIRQLCYELYVLQHIVSSGILLWLVYLHVPVYARYNVWLCVAFAIFDRGCRTVLLILRNTQICQNANGPGRAYALGFAMKVNVIANGYVLITLRNVDFSWKAGQHVFISTGPYGILQAHPFTISNLPDESKEARFVIKVHSGFTQKLSNYATNNQSQNLRAFVSIAYGSPPFDIIERSDSLILMATSTGASFVVPILEHVVRNSRGPRRIRFNWIVRESSHLDWFFRNIIAAGEKAKTNGVDISLQAYITKGDISSSPNTCAPPSTPSTINSAEYDTQAENLSPKESKKTDVICEKDLKGTQSSLQSSMPPGSSRIPSSIRTIMGRPGSLEDLIRPTIEESDGETAIIACGNAGFMAEIRHHAALLSDERAVHKGTGAQSIYVFSETYGW